MYCSKCGTQNPENTIQCINCGSPFSAASQPGVLNQPQTCGLAVASLVMGILSIFCNVILAIPAIICGIIALTKIGKSQGQLKGNGFAIAGIAVPVVVTVVITPILLAISLPALSKVKHLAAKEVCGCNVKGLSTAMMVYVNDYDGMLPTEYWCDLLIEEADVSPKSFVCPESDAIEGECCYAMNKHIAGMKLSNLPPDVVLLFETDMGLDEGSRNESIQSRRHYEFLNEFDNCYNENTLVYKDCFNQFGDIEDIWLYHYMNGSFGCNIVFADCHVEFVTEERIPSLRWTVE